MAGSGRRNADDQLLLALACGATLENAARQAGVALRTANRRAADPEFKRKLNALRWDMVERAVGMLTAAMGESARTLVVLQKETVPYPSRLGAARAVFEIGMKLREQNDLEQRLATLEEQIAATSNNGGSR
jgi:hypothetical protein